MKTILFILTLTVSVTANTGCKTKKGATSSTTTTTTTSSSSSTPGTSTTTTVTETNTSTSSNNQGAHAGKVSHKYRAGGCETVIVILAHDDIAEITLIPKDKLNKDIDVDGQTILFDYHPLKMPQPEGCTVGIPAEITNITKLK
ncbi:MAG TPA: hypothetical protein VGC65_00820 [Bacteroidia bacterium]|jgi:hypothetical protein